MTGALTKKEAILIVRAVLVPRTRHPRWAAMESTYFKRFRMEVDLRRDSPAVGPATLPPGYRFVPWNEALLDVHARTKFRAFRDEIDAVVFPCLGSLDGCRRLMREIRAKPGFLPATAWLIAGAAIVAIAVICFGPATVQSEDAMKAHRADCQARHPHDQQQSGENAPRAAGIEMGQAERALADLAQQNARNEKARDHKEDIHADKPTFEHRRKGVEDHYGEDGHRPQALDVRPVRHMHSRGHVSQIGKKVHPKAASPRPATMH